MVVPRRALLRGRALRRGVRVLTNELAGVQWAGRRGGGGVLGGEGRHGLSGLIAEGLGARHGRGVRLQRHQVCHLELRRSIEDSEDTRREGGGQRKVHRDGGERRSRSLRLKARGVQGRSGKAREGFRKFPTRGGRRKEFPVASGGGGKKQKGKREGYSH